MISQPKSRKSFVFLTILLLPVKIRKPVFISVKHLSVLGAPGGYNHSVPSSSLSWPPKRWKQLLHIIFQTLVSSLQTVQAVHPCGDNIFHSCPALQSVPFLHLLMQIKDIHIVLNMFCIFTSRNYNKSHLSMPTENNLCRCFSIFFAKSCKYQLIH